jgi:hypothetical protein
MVANGIVAWHEPSGAGTDTFAGHIIVTGSLSPAETIVIDCVQLAVRPPASVTVQLIPVVPIGYGSVNAWTTAGTGLPFSSVVAGVSSLRTPVTVPPPEALIVGVPGPPGNVYSVAPVGAVTEIFGGQVIVGGFVSRTVTVKEQLAAPSSDVEIIEWVPTAKNEPDAGLFVTAPQLPSAAAAPKVTNAPGTPPEVVFAVTTTFAGQSSVQVSDVAPEIIKLAVEELFFSPGSGVAGVAGTGTATLATLPVLKISVPAGTPEGTS